MQPFMILTLIYAIIILAGGFVGFIKAGSLASLIMSSFFSILLFIAAWAMWKDKVIGYFLSMGIATILTLFFSYRFTLSFKLMPAGLMALISLGILLIGFVQKK